MTFPLRNVGFKASVEWKRNAELPKTISPRQNAKLEHY